MSDIQKILEDNGYLGVRQMKNGEWVGVSIQIYTCGLCVGCDEFGYKRRYCYDKLTHALVAAALYEGEGDPDGPWIKVKGEDGERMGPGANGEGKTDKEVAIDKFLEDNNGFINVESMMLTLLAVFVLGLTLLGGYDIGRRNLVTDIKHFGCEKVIEIYEGKK